MTYQQPPTRSCAALAGEQYFADEGTILDLSKFRRTASVAGARGRLVKVGANIYEADELLKPVNDRIPVRLVGNNSGHVITNPLDPARAQRMAKKLKARGFNFARIHGIESYLMQWGDMYELPVTNVTGTRNYSPDRWAELDNFLYVLKQNGIYYSFGPASKNLAMNIFGRDRWDEVFNVTGTATATIVNGKITSVAPLANNAVKYPDPPTVLCVDAVNSNGHGAVIRSTIDAIGNITGYIVDNQGDGYTASNGTPNGTSTTVITHFGGTGKCKMRLRMDQVMRNHLRDVHYDFLNRVSPHTGVAYKDEPALCMVEIMNEAHMQIIIGTALTQVRPLWVNWLADRYGTIATLNAAWGGTTFQGFWDAGLQIILGTSSPPDGTKGAIARWSDSQKFIADNDVEFYSWFVNQIKATGYPGMIVCRDMVGEPVISRLYAETGCDMQSVHAYPALADSFNTGVKFSTAAAAAANAPAHYAYGTNPIYLCLGVVTENVPWMFGEFGFCWPGIYRGELGLLAAAYSSTHNSSGICLHSEAYNSFEFGPSNLNGMKALRPNQYDHDPLSNGSVWLMSLAYSRGDIKTLPITKTYIMNHRALNSIPDAASMQAATLTYSFVQAGTPSAFQAVVPCARHVVRWDTTNPHDLTIANAWRTDIVKNTATLMADHGFNSGNVSQYELSDWILSKGNDTLWGSYEYPASAIRYVKAESGKPAEVFADRQAGLFGISTPRTQALVCSGKFAQGVASHVRKGNAMAVANASKNVVAEPGFAYHTNFKGRRFWEQLSVDYIEDGTLLAVTSSDLRPISECENLVVVVGSNYYNTGQTHQPCEKIISSITLGGTASGYPDVTEWAISQSSAAQASVIVTSVGGVPASYRIVSQSGNFTSTSLTVSRVNGGAGTGLTWAFTLADAPESAEMCMGTPFTGTEEGWPILQKNFTTVFTLTGLDMSVPWVLYELDFKGHRVSSFPTRKTRRGLQVKIDSLHSVKPTVYYELVKGQRHYKTRN